MADITPSAEAVHSNRNGLIWNPITEADTNLGGKIQGGVYALTIEGAFGGTSIEWEFAREDVDGNYHSIDSTNLTFTANKTYNVQLPKGFIRPKRTGGSSTSVKAYATPIPDSAA